MLIIPIHEVCEEHEFHDVPHNRPNNQALFKAMNNSADMANTTTHPLETDKVRDVHIRTVVIACVFDENDALGYE